MKIKTKKGTNKTSIKWTKDKIKINLKKREKIGMGQKKRKSIKKEETQYTNN